MTKPYIVRGPLNVFTETDSLYEALEVCGDHDTIYERLGHSTGDNIDREDRLAEAARAVERLLDSAEWSEPADLAAIDELRAAIAAHDKALAEMRAVWAANERSQA